MRLFTAQLPTHEKSLEHAAAYALLTHAVEVIYHMPLPDIARDSHGKPYFPAHPEICFNLSHCRGLAACQGAGNRHFLSAPHGGFCPGRRNGHGTPGRLAVPAVPAGKRSCGLLLCLARGYAPGISGTYRNITPPVGVAFVKSHP